VTNVSRPMCHDGVLSGGRRFKEGGNDEIIPSGAGR
jgi:hypothetical protein